MGHQYRGTDLKHRDQVILELWNPPNNMNLRQIAEVVDLSHVRVWQILNKYVQKYVQPLADEYRAKISAECELALDAIRPRVLDGDTAAIMAQQKVLSRLAKLYGTDMPTITANVDFTATWKGYLDGEVVND